MLPDGPRSRIVRPADALEDLCPVARKYPGDVRLPRAVQIVDAPLELAQGMLSGLAVPLDLTIFGLLVSA